MDDDQTSETPRSNHDNVELAGAALWFDCSLGHDVFFEGWFPLRGGEDSR